MLDELEAQLCASVPELDGEFPREACRLRCVRDPDFRRRTRRSVCNYARQQVGEECPGASALVLGPSLFRSC